MLSLPLSTQRNRPLSATGELEQISDRLDVVSNGVKTAGNRMRPYVDGENAFPKLLASLNSAQHSITYETFAFAGNDPTSKQVVDALIAAKNRGVDVKVLADALGSKNFLFLKNPQLQRLKDAGVSVELFQPLDRFNSAILHRDHRKTVVVDGKAGWIGGMNTGDAWFGLPSTKNRLHDVFAEVEGGAVDSMVADFADSWGHVDSLAAAHAAAAPVRASEGGTQVRIVEHTPGQDTNIRNTYLTLIEAAQKNIFLENHFPLTQQLTDALAAAARRGVRVDYIVSETKVGDVVTQMRFPELLKAGVHIHVFPDGIHTKAMSVDGLVSTLGSSNVDGVSLFRNREIIAVMEDPAFTQRLDQVLFRRDLTGDAQGRKTREFTAADIGPAKAALLWVLRHVIPATVQ